MEAQVQRKLIFNGVDIVNVNFHVHGEVQINENTVVDLSVVPKVFFPENFPVDFTIVMEVQISVKDSFHLNVISFGKFALDIVASSAEAKPFINVNAPAIMFPYVRAFISTFSTSVGSVIKPIILPTHFFHGDMETIERPQPNKE